MVPALRLPFGESRGKRSGTAVVEGFRYRETQPTITLLLSLGGESNQGARNRVSLKNLGIDSKIIVETRFLC